MGKKKREESAPVMVWTLTTNRSKQFTVPLFALNPEADYQYIPASRMRAAIHRKSITFANASSIPKTLAAVNAIIVLAETVRDELIKQGITE